MPKIFKIFIILFVFSLLSFYFFVPIVTAENLLFSDNFDDGNLDGWTIQAGNWFIENGNLINTQTQRDFLADIHPASADWENYRIEFDVNTEVGNDNGIVFRKQGNSLYGFNIRHDTLPSIKLFKTENNASILIDAYWNMVLSQNLWYHIKVEVVDENIKIWVNDTLGLEYTDLSTSLRRGGIGFQTWTGWNDSLRIRFDNLKVTTLESEPAKTPLILIPGIGGSELKVAEDTIWSKDDGHGGIFNHAYSTEEKVWVNEGEAANPGNDDYFDVLRMKPDGITSEASIDLTGNLYPGAYQEAINFFIDRGYTLNQDFFVFAYDWRKDNIEASNLLDQKIQEIKEETGSSNVDIVAHSMGGLIARYYISDNQKAQNVRKLFTLGVPHLGSPDYLKNIRYGGCLRFEVGPFCLLLAPSEVQDVIQNMISGFQLSPTQSYFNFYSGEDSQYPYPYRTESGALNYSQIKNLLTTLGHNTSLFTPSESLHAIDTNLSNANGVDVTIIAGSGQATLGQIIEETTTSLLGTQTIHKDIIRINGDDTVPLFSASLNDPAKGKSLLGSAIIYYTNQKHGGLVTNGPALNLVKNILEDKSEIPSGVSNTAYRFQGTSLSVHSPVRIHVYDANGSHTGPTEDGGFEANIPGSSYDTLGDAKFIYLPDDGVYSIKFQATGQGSFDFKIRKFENDENTKTIFYKEAPLTERTEAETVFDTSFAETPTIQVDANGDGTVDLNVEKFSVMEGNANFDYTPPIISFDVNPKSIWPPNNKMVEVDITGSVRDEYPYLVRILVDDEYNLVEPSIAVRNQTEINQTIKLAASRKGKDKDGRKYNIKVLATDLAGNTSVSTFEVVVLHNQGKKR